MRKQGMFKQSSILEERERERQRDDVKSYQTTAALHLPL